MLVCVSVLVLMVVLMELVGHGWDGGLGLNRPAGASRGGGGGHGGSS